MGDPKKPRADFSDVTRGSSSTAPGTPPVERTYTVVSGDSLSKIAKKDFTVSN